MWELQTQAFEYGWLQYPESFSVVSEVSVLPFNRNNFWCSLYPGPLVFCSFFPRAFRFLKPAEPLKLGEYIVTLSNLRRPRWLGENFWMEIIGECLGTNETYKFVFCSYSLWNLRTLRFCCIFSLWFCSTNFTLPKLCQTQPIGQCSRERYNFIAYGIKECIIKCLTNA